MVVFVAETKSIYQEAINDALGGPELDGVVHCEMIKIRNGLSLVVGNLSENLHKTRARCPFRRTFARDHRGLGRVVL